MANRWLVNVGNCGAIAGLVAVALGCSGLKAPPRNGDAPGHAPAAPSAPHVAFKRIEADGVSVFYREAGAANAPLVLLLHGFPASSHMFRELIPRLATRYRVIAPDLPGFGFTQVPAERRYRYSFDGLAKTTEAFVAALGLHSYALYVFDYGAPVGLRLALAHPERVTALISQNGNAYEEGLGEIWSPIRRYWATPSVENREALKGALTFEGTREQYLVGARDPSQVAPEAYALDAALLERPGQTDIQLDLFLDYASNVKLYPRFQAYFREHKPPTLAIWGMHDPYFIPAGAEAYRRDNPNAQVKMLDAGHFALETNVAEIAAGITELLH
jgi:pimeloyl-ACP methyl ester carboxylesterase